MYMYLRNIEGVFLSPIKEPHYFAPNTPSYPLLNHIRDEEKYLKLFKGVKNEKLEKEVNSLGQEGWEFVGPGLNDGINAMILLFKRPV